MIDKRITIFAGHYGSGKTSVAVNYALYLRRKFPDKKITLADLDIVNPYYRTKDSADVLEKNGISLISSKYANSNLDVPSMPSAAMSLFDDKSLLGIIDVGGDDRGALAIGKYAEHIKEEEDKNVLLVVNVYRPLSRTAADIISIKEEVEYAGKFAFNGIVNNSNVGNETTLSYIENSAKIIDEVCQKTGLQVFMTCKPMFISDGDYFTLNGLRHPFTFL
ncbi:hypothetical protein AGMMS49975_07430 [Clostridia bacterium]|nr:hypothetical protein AGMMS49975_07430 [Clostridia bacterium]